MAVLDDGVLGRPELTTVVDVATRTIAATVLRPDDGLLSRLGAADRVVRRMRAALPPGVGVGGLCPHCDEPAAIPDLLEAAETPAELDVITMPDR